MKLESQDGFLYIELLVSMMVLSLALLAIVPMFVMAQAENAAAQDFTFAVAIAQAKVEELKGGDFDGLSGGSDSIVAHGIPFTRSWTVTNDSPYSGMKSMTVTVTPIRNQTFGQSRSAILTFRRVL